MELSVTYVMSQVFIIFTYIFLAISYQMKNYRKILIINIFALFFACLSYLCLRAYTGVAMNIVAILRNIIFIVNEKKNGLSKKVTRNDIYLLLFIYVITIILTIFTYDGVFSLMVVMATMLYTYSIWQKNTKTYKMLGIPISFIWIIYNIYIKSIFAICFEIILLICEIIGVILEGNKNGRIKKL